MHLTHVATVEQDYCHEDRKTKKKKKRERTKGASKTEEETRHAGDSIDGSYAQ